MELGCGLSYLFKRFYRKKAIIPFLLYDHSYKVVVQTSIYLFSQNRFLRCPRQFEDVAYFKSNNFPLKRLANHYWFTQAVCLLGIAFGLRFTQLKNRLVTESTSSHFSMGARLYLKRSLKFIKLLTPISV